MIEELYTASQHGAKIEIVARSICMLKPGVPGMSENITVRSIVGRYLEHSRLYGFEIGDEVEVFLGSADLMTRNLDRRIEVVVPVEQTRLPPGDGRRSSTVRSRTRRRRGSSLPTGAGRGESAARRSARTATSSTCSGGRACAHAGRAARGASDQARGV